MKIEIMKIRGLKDSLFITTEHIPKKFRIPGKTIDGSQKITSFTRHVYIIEKFKTKMLIKSDFLNSEMMVPNVGENRLTIENCKNMTAKFNINNTGPPIKRMVHSNGVSKIPTKFNSTIFFKPCGNGLPAGRYFIFIPKKLTN